MLNYEELLGAETKSLLEYKAKIPKQNIVNPSSNWVDDIFVSSDRKISTLRNLQLMLSSGRLADTGYLSILPVDQGIEHSAGASFAPNL